MPKYMNNSTISANDWAPIRFSNRAGYDHMSWDACLKAPEPTWAPNTGLVYSGSCGIFVIPRTPNNCVYHTDTPYNITTGATEPIWPTNTGDIVKENVTYTRSGKPVTRTWIADCGAAMSNVAIRNNIFDMDGTSSDEVIEFTRMYPSGTTASERENCQ